jgi:DNA-binding MarR family transcriptional regulator
MPHTNPSSWAKAKRFIAAKEKKLNLARLDGLGRDYLDWIVERCKTHTPLHVQEIVTQSGVASPGSAHKYIHVLQRAKFIVILVDKEDLRRKIVRPTPLALREIKAVDQAFKVWIKRHQPS